MNGQGTYNFSRNSVTLEQLAERDGCMSVFSLHREIFSSFTFIILFKVIKLKSLNSVHFI